MSYKIGLVSLRPNGGSLDPEAGDLDVWLTVCKVIR